MTSPPERERDIAPEEAFSLLGNDTRMSILQVLGAADGPLSFTEIREAVGIRQGGQFNYHLDKLVGHFVDKTNGGYALRQPGQRVVEAVLSGAVTMDPVHEPQPIDFTCRICGEQIHVSYRGERLELYCTECVGQYSRSEKGRDSVFDDPDGWLGGYHLGPAGAMDRDPHEMLHASSLKSHLQVLAWANGLCPACDGTVERSVNVCEYHTGGDQLCDRCQRRHAVQVHVTCTNCPNEIDGMAINVLAAHLPLRQFIADHGIDPIVEGFKWGWDYKEEIRSHDPLEIAFTFELDGEAMTVVVDDQLTVIDVERERIPV